MEPLQIKVYRGRFSDSEKYLGVVKFTGDEFDYTELDVGEVAECKSVLELPQAEYVGHGPKDGYGRHSVQLVEHKPFTVEQLSSISNRRLVNGLFFELDFGALLE